MASKYPARLHAQRTLEKLQHLLSETDKTKPQLLYLASEIVHYRNDTDRELPFRQESNYFYLTGCDVPESAVLVFHPGVPSGSSDPDAYGSSLQTVLFIPKDDPLVTMWTPPPPTLAAASENYDFRSVQLTSDLISVATTFLAGYRDTIIHTLPQATQFPALSTEFLKSFGSSSTPAYLLSALSLSRLIKTPHEIELIRKANAISSRAHEVVMRLLGRDAAGLIRGPQENGLTMPDAWRIEKEAEAEAVFVASCRREGAVHQAYLPIVASAQRASTLHYCCNDRDFAWGPVVHDHTSDLQMTQVNGTSQGHRFVPQVLLLDAGCEWSNYASDITRTTPVGNGGKFTKEARDIYSLVLKMQNDSIKCLKPGVHWDTIHRQNHVTLVQGFISLGIFKGDAQDVLNSGVSAAFFPHGLGHSLGMDVHDVPSASKPDVALNTTIPEESKKNPEFYTYLRLRLPLQAGMTVEPGVYFSPHLLAPIRNSPHINHEVLARYESVGGVRIEDVLLITEHGSENLTTVGKEVDWLERVCSGQD
ncbi:hypothetical protein FRB95_002771 [Tulasnella sp. JGI-2019a]|nr:hypothetical protein FRB95_002771 [Tulasnella sp. JGI-2019a]